MKIKSNGLVLLKLTRFSLIRINTHKYIVIRTVTITFQLWHVEIQRLRPRAQPWVAPDVLLGFKYHNVHFRYKNEYQDCCCTYNGAEGKSKGLKTASNTIIHRDERNPYHTRGVHAEANKLCLVKIQWRFTSPERVNCTKYDKESVVCKQTGHSYSAYVTLDEDKIFVFIRSNGFRWSNWKFCNRHRDFWRNNHSGYQKLRLWADERGRFNSAKNARNSICAH